MIDSIDDPRLDDEERQIYRRWGFASELCVPLVVDDKVHGIIDIYDDKERDFSGEVDFLMAVGQVLAGALQKMLLLTKLERGNEELGLLVESGLEFGSTLDLEHVLGSVAQRLRDVAGVVCCDIYTLRGDRSVGLVSVDENGIDASFPETTYAWPTSRSQARSPSRASPRG